MTSYTKLNNGISIQQLEEKKTELFDQMRKHPEKEQELAQEYFSIDQQIIQFYKKQNTIHSGSEPQ